MASESREDGGSAIPAWVHDVDRALASAMRETPLLATATPCGGATRQEIVRAFEADDPRAPRWTYAPPGEERSAAVARALESVAAEVEARDPGALGRAYAARARELAIEARVAAAVGTSGFAAIARARFPPGGVPSEASSLAALWVVDDEPAPASDCTSDADDPSSLAARLAQEIGRRRLPFRVVRSRSLAPLAATGDRTIWVATGRSLSRVDVERTVLHEIEGHALPRARASVLMPGLFALGTARGVDDQEGLALVLEERHGFLRGARRRELAIRHRAVEAMDAGGTFVEVVRTLVARDGAEIPRAVAAAERAFRGSAGETAGLGRERVYLDAYARVGAHLRARPEDERVIASGQVALDAIGALAEFATI